MYMTFPIINDILGYRILDYYIRLLSQLPCCYSPCNIQLPFSFSSLVNELLYMSHTVYSSLPIEIVIFYGYEYRIDMTPSILTFVSHVAGDPFSCSQL